MLSSRSFLIACSSGSFESFGAVDAVHAQGRGQFGGDGRDFTGPAGQAMIGRGPRDRVQRLDHVQAVHFLLRILVVQPAAGGEVAGVLDGQRRAAAEQIGIQAHDDLGIGQFQHRQHVLTEGGTRALADVVVAHRFVFVPLGLGKFFLESWPASLARLGELLASLRTQNPLPSAGICLMNSRGTRPMRLAPRSLLVDGHRR